MVNYRGERFAGYNKAKRTPNHKTKSHAVLAKKGKKIRQGRNHTMHDIMHKIQTQIFLVQDIGRIK